jgi:hypothetical protein
MDIGTIVALVGICVTIAGAIFRLYRALDGKIDREISALHGRVSELREDTANDYMRRDLWEAHFSHFEARLKEISGDIKKLLHQRPQSAE